MMHTKIEELTSRERMEKLLLEKFGLSELKTGTQISRDEKGWRQDEKSIEYIWIVMMSRSFVGWGGLIAIKFKEHTFRDKHHPNELLEGIFTIGPGNEIKEFYSEKNMNVDSDPLIGNFHFDLFNANNGITLDGVSYSIHVISPNIDTIITVNNPNTQRWKSWEMEIWRLGQRLAYNSKCKELNELFE